MTTINRRPAVEGGWALFRRAGYSYSIDQYDIGQVNRVTDTRVYANAGYVSRHQVENVYPAESEDAARGALDLLQQAQKRYEEEHQLAKDRFQASRDMILGKLADKKDADPS